MNLTARADLLRKKSCEITKMHADVYNHSIRPDKTQKCLRQCVFINTVSCNRLTNCFAIHDGKWVEVKGHYLPLLPQFMRRNAATKKLVSHKANWIQERFLPARRIFIPDATPELPRQI